ncbi:MAG: DUF4157 domain-containing protein [Nitrospira sp.]
MTVCPVGKFKSRLELSSRRSGARQPELVSSLPAHDQLQIQRKSSCPCGGGCPACQAKSNDLKLSRPGDPAEIEADRIADGVMSAPGHSPVKGAWPRIQRFSGQSDRRMDGAHTDAGHILTSGGRPLDLSLQYDMGQRFGYDFSSVRVHTGTVAEQSARDVSAHAYTVGNNIVFGQGQFAPETQAGRRLLAHELAHVIQQSVGAPVVQRQITIPIFDEFDPCVIDPVFGKKVCGSYAKTACEKVPSLPGCSFVCRKLGCKKPEKPSVSCPSGFRPGRSAEFKDQCCIEKRTTNPDQTTEDNTIESASNCCPPARAASTPLGLRCCPAGEVASNGQCISGSEPQPPGPIPAPSPFVPCLPGERPNLFGGCCGPGDHTDKQGHPCLPQPTPTPIPDQPSISAPGNVVLHFDQDRPMSGWAKTEATLLRSLTTESKSVWPILLEQLQGNPSLALQLVGKASPEGPETYNLDLAQRRAQLVMEVLVDKGVGRGRIVDVAPECTQVETGVYACGEVGALGPEDRQVKAVFDATTAPNP